MKMLTCFRKVLKEVSLTTLYQPIVDLQSGAIIGYEGLIRGPSDSPLHVTSTLFNVARLCGETVVLERLCRTVPIGRFVQLGLSGKLLLNTSPDVLLMPAVESGASLLRHALVGIVPVEVGTELTETNSPSKSPKVG